MTDSDDHDEREVARICAEIGALGRCLPGSISARLLRCGNPKCRCRDAEVDRRHGPYRYWTRKVGGKTASRLLSAEQARRYQPWLDNDRRLRALTRELEALAIRAAERAEGWGEK